jgi:hypothetical protein
MDLKKPLAVYTKKEKSSWPYYVKSFYKSLIANMIVMAKGKSYGQVVSKRKQYNAQ